eukprot:g1284.t1
MRGSGGEEEDSQFKNPLLVGKSATGQERNTATIGKSGLRTDSAMNKANEKKSTMIRRIALFVLVIQGSMVVICMRYSRIPQQGVEPYRPTTAVACTEFLKILIASLVVLWTEKHPVEHMYEEIFVNWRMTLKVGIPAFLYTIQNNLLYFALSELDASVYQVLYQVKLLTTAIFSVFLLGRSFSLIRWLSLGLLAIGVAVVQLSGNAGENEDGVSLHMSTQGVLALFVAACLSGLAGVWFEKMLKESKVSLWMRNVQLGAFSLMFSLLSVQSENWNGNTRPFFTGYEPIVMLVIFIGACGGLLVAVVMKYADNILKGFALSISIILTSVISYLLPDFDFQPSVLFLFGTAIVLFATFVYNTETFDVFGVMKRRTKSSEKVSLKRRDPASGV